MSAAVRHTMSCWIGFEPASKSLRTRVDGDVRNRLQPT